MAQRGSLEEGARSNNCHEQLLMCGVQSLSDKKDIITSLVSALDSMCTALSKLNAEVACIAVHDESTFVLGTEKGKVFLNARRELQKEFVKYCASWNAQLRGMEMLKMVAENGRNVQRDSLDPMSDVYVLRKMVEEVFAVLYSEALEKSTIVPVPYEKILKDPPSVIVHGLPDGVCFKRPSEYEAHTLKRILERSNRIRFTVKRSLDEDIQELRTCVELNREIQPGKSICDFNRESPMAKLSNHDTSNVRTPPQFLYELPGSRIPLDLNQELLTARPTTNFNHDLSPTGASIIMDSKKLPPARDCADDTGKNTTGFIGELSNISQHSHVSKRLLFSIVHDKAEKWNLYIKETEDINILRECVQILFNSRYAEALGLDHMVPVPYRKIACDPDAVEIIGIPEGIPFKRPCTYGVPKLKRILEARHKVRFVIKRMFDERVLTGTKYIREGSKQDGHSPLDEESHRTMTIDMNPNNHVCRSMKMKESETGTSLDLSTLKKVKTEPEDAEIIQITVQDPNTSLDDLSENLSDKSSCDEPDILVESPSDPVQDDVSNHKDQHVVVEEEWNQKIVQLRKQVENLFNRKYGEAMGFSDPVKVPYLKFQSHPEELFVDGLPDDIPFRTPNCFGISKLQKILDVSENIRFIIKRPQLLLDEVQDTCKERTNSGVSTQEPRDSVKDESTQLKRQIQAGSPLGSRMACFHSTSEVSDEANVGLADPATELPDKATVKHLTSSDGNKSNNSLNIIEVTIPENYDAKLTRVDIANNLREQVQDLFNRKYGEALGIKYPVQVPYKRIKSNPGSVIIEGLPPGIPFRKPCTFGSQNLERILAVADKIKFTITRPFQGLIPKPAPRRITSLEKAYAALQEDEEANRLGEKVILREQVKELFNEKYGEALGLNRPVLVPYKLIRDNPEAIEVTGLPDDILFRNPTTYDLNRLEKILKVRDRIRMIIKSQLQPFAEICNEASKSASKPETVHKRKRRRMSEGNIGPSSSNMEAGVSPNPVSLVQWPMYLVDYGAVNMQIQGPVNF
ncbi:general transcription factor II-I repeat domain-containing protein 1 isoform X3 [Pristis pectinata]|uniref:general transcription factor II-I repeat domain-containing protein 1 isoform X3 n=1 Tax=Pristis pectinata TaxID=685728 RepID=UPI00223C9C13|nr:general transcription factor II-I repeat domain-containing protein 1 isoform X3 [Pristis pectinata]